MSKDFIISTDSACDCSSEKLEERGVSCIVMEYLHGNVSYPVSYKEKDLKDFYEKMRKGVVFKTSQINIQRYYDYFSSLLKESRNILHISLGSGLSNTIHNAIAAKTMLENENSDVHIEIIDSRFASLAELMLVDKARDARDDGKTFGETIGIVNYYVEHLDTFYTTDTLSYFVRGGRLSKFSGFVGSLMKINPILNVNKEGHLKVKTKAIGEKKAFASILKMMKEQALQPQDQMLYVMHGDCYEKTKECAETLVKEIGFRGYEMFFEGPIIGCHSGPGLKGFFFFGQQR